MSRSRGGGAATGGGIGILAVLLILITPQGQAIGRWVGHLLQSGDKAIASHSGGGSTDGSTSVPPASPVNKPQANDALAALNKLTVLPARPSVPGYQRSCSSGDACSFGPAWTDDTSAPGGHNGCDTRNDILRSVMSHVTYRSGSTCVVESGTYADPYTGKAVSWTKTHATTLQVDHVVPLALAWDLGASKWTQDQRDAYANDEATVLLLADGPANEAKGDSGPGEWMPPNTGYACNYDAKFVSILTKYHLPVVKADKSAMSAMLSRCGS